MYKINLRFLATVFIDAQSITPNARLMAAIGEILGDQYVPAAVVEQTLTGPQNRIGFVSVNGEWNIVLATNRLDFTKAPVNQEGSNMGAFDDFCAYASHLLPSVLEKIGRTGTRLASAQEGLLADEYQEDGYRLSARLLHLPNSIRQTEMMEWNWRCVSQRERDFGPREEINTIASIYRGYFDFGPTATPTLQQNINGTRFDIDINTVATNTDQRFDRSSISSFFTESPRWHSDLIAEVSQLAEEG